MFYGVTVGVSAEGTIIISFLILVYCNPGACPNLKLCLSLEKNYLVFQLSRFRPVYINKLPLSIIKCKTYLFKYFDKYKFVWFFFFFAQSCIIIPLLFKRIIKINKQKKMLNCVISHFVPFHYLSFIFFSSVTSVLFLVFVCYICLVNMCPTFLVCDIQILFIKVWPYMRLTNRFFKHFQIWWCD